jgi:hypothetical protein
VLDSLVESLTKYTLVLNPASPKAAVLFGFNAKAKLATETIFELANRCAPTLSCGSQLLLACLNFSLLG